jgi:hypothetical protein
MLLNTVGDKNSFKNSMEKYLILFEEIFLLPFHLGRFVKHFMFSIKSKIV